MMKIMLEEDAMHNCKAKKKTIFRTLRGIPCPKYRNVWNIRGTENLGTSHKFWVFSEICGNQQTQKDLHTYDIF